MITVYSKNNCPYCDRAKALLENKGVEFQVVNIEDQPDARQFLVDQGLRSVPQIFNGEEIIQGGYQGLASKTEEFWTALQG